MKFVLITYDGHGLPIAFRLMKEGYDVLVGQVKKLEHMPKEDEITTERRLMLYDGLLEKLDADELVEKLLNEKNKDDYFIFCDFNYVYPYAEKLKKAGFKGLLPTREDFELEENRNKTKELIAKNYSIFAKEEVIEFNKIKDAIEFLNNEGAEKIWGVKGNNPESPTYFPATNNKAIAKEDLMEILENNQKLYESEGFILEEKIEDLIEFVPEIITFDEEILGVNIDIELKPFGAGNTAWQTGDSASMIMWISPEDWGKIIPLFFPKNMSKYYLRKNEMVIWDAGVMYSPSRNALYFTEFCSNREGWNAVFNKLSTFIKTGDYFERILNKQPLFTDEVFPYGCSIRVFNEIRENKKDLEKYTISDQKFFANLDNPNIWLWDVKSKNGKLYTVGYDNNLAIITQGGVDWRICFKIIDDILQKGQEFFYGLSYWRRYFDILNTEYWGNITQRFNWVQGNILGEEFLIDNKEQIIEKTLRILAIRHNISNQIVYKLQSELGSIDQLIGKYLNKQDE